MKRKETTFLSTIERVTLISIKPKKERELKPGAILCSTWGYGQTNINFYCVTKLTEKTVTLIPMIAKVTKGKHENTNLPDSIDKYKKTFTRNIREKLNILNNKIKYVSKESFEDLYLWDGKPKKSTTISLGH